MSVHLLIGGAVVVAAGVAVYLEDRRRARRRGRDMEALIEATREDMPDVLHVPDEWVKEHGR